MSAPQTQGVREKRNERPACEVAFRYKPRLVSGRGSLLFLLISCSFALPAAAQEGEAPPADAPAEVEAPPEQPADPADPAEPVEPEPGPGQPDDGWAAVATDEEPAEPPSEIPEEAEEAANEPEPESPQHGFVFGSYGRVQVASDLDGHSGSNADFTSRSPRIDEGTYMEIQLERDDAWSSGMETNIVFTLALRGPLFHFDGEFQEDIAVRQLYAEVKNALVPRLRLWAGSRMVRGDDVYLHDFWPLDNLNMIGGGVGYEVDNQVELAFQLGMARPNEAFYTQSVPSVSYGSFLPSDVLLLDRPRLVLSAKATYYPLNRRVLEGIKIVGYAESHHISSGQREDDAGETEPLPSDSGYVLGLQLGGWIVENRAFANLFVRYARGLAVYDPLGVPFRVGSVIDTGRAEDLMIAFSGNYEAGMFGVQVGAHIHRLRDADESILSRGAITEGVITVRPHLWFGEYAGIAADLSFLGLETTTLDDRTGNLRRGSAFKFGLMPFFSPNGRGTYTRPQLRLIYALTVRDDDAGQLFPMRDRRATDGVEHFLGIGAEWWFDSSYRRD